MRTLFQLILIIISKIAFCQGVSDTIKKMAIECNTWSSENQKLYKALKDYKCICIGEMHGTREPAEFLTGLTKTFIANGRKVLVGIETTTMTMAEFIVQPDSVGLSKSAFFNRKRTDGRNSKAWYEAIKECNKLGAKFCFFDDIFENRDSMMYENLIEYYKHDTSLVIITLSGNIHNKLVPHKESKTMGCYLKNYFKKRVFSINHMAGEGTMYSLTSEGLGIHSIGSSENAYTTATSYDAYFILNIFNPANGYSGYFYTKKMTASLPH